MSTEVQAGRGGMLANWLRVAWKPPLLVVACLVLSALILPRYLNSGGSLYGHPFSVETSIRWYFGVAMALSLLVSALVRWPHWSRGMRQTWWALAALLLAFIPIFLFDETLLWLEDSWIRYPTALALIGAGFASLYLVKRRLTSARPFGEAISWLLLACCFIFLGADEHLELHERLGDWLQLMPTFASLDQDWITLAYVVLGASFLLLYWVILGRHISLGQQQHLGPYVTAIAVFGLAQTFDSFDLTVRSALSEVATRFAAQGHGFPDLWFVLYRPRQFLNSVEELLECVAAVLLLVSTVSLAVGGAEGRLADRGASPNSPLKVPGSGLRVGRWMLTLVVVALVVFNWPAAMSRSPFLDGARLVESHPVSRKQTSGFRKAVVLPNGDRLEVSRSKRVLLRRSVGNRKLGRLRVRLMLRDVRGVRIDEDGALSLLTSSGRDSIMRRVVWKTGAARELSSIGAK